MCKDTFHYHLTHTPCPSDLKVSDCFAEGSRDICHGTSMSVLAVPQLSTLKSSQEKLQEPHSPVLCCWALSHLPEQNVSSVTAGLASVLFSIPSASLCA